MTVNDDTFEPITRVLEIILKNGFNSVKRKSRLHNIKSESYMLRVILDISENHIYTRPHKSNKELTQEI